MFQIFVVIGSVLGLCYVLLISRFALGWRRLGKKKYLKVRTIQVSVIIAARNEQENIAACLDALLRQDYPRENYEIIIVNDHSEDDTALLVESYGQKHSNVRLEQLGEGLIGKKQAIRKGIELSGAELIITSDADCVMPAGWLTAMVACQQGEDAVMVSGPVVFRNERTLFEKMQSLEFMALISSGGGSLAYGKAILCNGANLAYKREAYHAVGGFESEDGRASGDDVLLMYRMNELFRGKVSFLKEEDAIVSTKAAASVSEFFSQRRRWASKGFSAYNAEAKYTALVVYFFNSLILAGPLVDWFCNRHGEIYLHLTGFCLILAGIKCFFDFLLLFLAASFFKKERLLLLFLPEQILYVFYVVVTGIVGSFGRYEWKGRKTN
ncbi:MAG: glycosyltransferase [Bacteroidia bacterium]